jgi:hypothetical protein
VVPADQLADGRRRAGLDAGQLGEGRTEAEQPERLPLGDQRPEVVPRQRIVDEVAAAERGHHVLDAGAHRGAGRHRDPLVREGVAGGLPPAADRPDHHASGMKTSSR